MKRGLVVPAEDNGVPFETGPNTILLSDVLLQNGQFSNMAEFPVLQMLYRQGMIIPNHPRNTGEKPRLIGHRDQVTAQMRYIYRGNYGLHNEQELIEAGASPEQARAMIRMKLSFAFGKIRHSDEFLDTLFIEGQEVEIKNGVTIRRLQVNVFEIRFKGHSVTVDLNLAPLERYESPYPLGYHQIRREYFSVVHSGNGDGWDVNRPSMSSILMFQGKIYLIDAGPSIENSLISLGIGINEIEGIFHTHSHDDHFAGLASLIRADRRLKYYATPLVRVSVSKKLAALLSIDEQNFAHYFEVHDLAYDAWNNIEGLEVKPQFSPHPVETSIFQFRTLWEDGYRSYAHFADIVALSVLKDMVTDDPEKPGVSQQMYDEVSRTYLTRTDVKKIDCGGGMIHGQAEDFTDDESGKIIISHMARDLTDHEKEIGSGAPFGATEVLIPACQDYILRVAFHFLRSHLPTAPLHQLRMLLNNDTALLNPESIILKAGAKPTDLYLVLTGNVEVIDAEANLRSQVYAGTLIGEQPCLHDQGSTRTYRATSFVQALKIPTELFSRFVEINHLREDLDRLRIYRNFLEKTRLFSESIGQATQNRITQAMGSENYARGHDFRHADGRMLYLIKSGSITCKLGEIHAETLKPGDFFGEESAIFDTSSIFTFIAAEETECYLIPGGLLRDAPIVRWKLFEAFERRMQLLSKMDDENDSVFNWRNEYALDVPEMDAQHIKLFELGEKFSEASLNGDATAAQREERLDALISLSIEHFANEEAMLRQVGFQHRREHQARHESLIRQVHAEKERLAAHEFRMDEGFNSFFKDWIVRHILIEDRKYAAFLKNQAQSYII
ncbi:putative cyclic nucleotide-binding protein [Magnetofaba australis IT-1]|uniref:Putative cyclic nucleotide-binding protein n=2 Tax=Magnetofaba TaxID=1472292 RepID=A0A1Y2KBY1_9PROT|nr:putative cyclic nucleotide-binding protein [Magnetofaba australis IT-1]